MEARQRRTYGLRREWRLSRFRKEVFRFFPDAANLSRITPPSLQVDVFFVGPDLERVFLFRKLEPMRIFATGK